MLSFELKKALLSLGMFIISTLDNCCKIFLMMAFLIPLRHSLQGVDQSCQSVFTQRCALVHVHARKIMLHMKFIYFSNTNLEHF